MIIRFSDHTIPSCVTFSELRPFLALRCPLIKYPKTWSLLDCLLVEILSNLMKPPLREIHFWAVSSVYLWQYVYWFCTWRVYNNNQLIHYFFSHIQRSCQVWVGIIFKVFWEQGVELTSSDYHWFLTFWSFSVYALISSNARRCRSVIRPTLLFLKALTKSTIISCLWNWCLRNYLCFSRTTFFKNE